MSAITLIVVIAAVFFVIERLAPGRALPQSPGWYLRALALNFTQIAVVLLAGLSWERWLQGASLWQIGEWMPAPVQGLLAWFIGTFVFYWWHRARHASDLLWRTLHQIHHSAARIEILTAFYKHPAEMASNSAIISLVLFTLLGASPEAALWFNLFAVTGEFFYHANLKTPQWVGYLFQRPEHHSIHHQFGVHHYNYGDITWWDRLFGTFKDVDEFAERCGFEPEREQRLPEMLAWRDVHRTPAGEAVPQ